MNHQHLLRRFVWYWLVLALSSLLALGLYGLYLRELKSVESRLEIP